MYRHRLRLALSAAFALVAVSIYGSQGEARRRNPVPLPSPAVGRLERVLGDLVKCSDIENAKERLECYDALAGRGLARLEFPLSVAPAPKPSPLR